MSLWRDELRPSRAGVVIVIALALLAALSLERTFTSTKYLLWALPAMAVGATFALVFGRRSLGAAFAGLVVVEVFTLPALFARHETVFGLPTSTAWRTVVDLFGTGVSGVMREAAPVLPEQRFLVVIWSVAIVLGFLGASWIVVGRPIGAAVTAIGVVAFAGQVGAGPGRNVYAGAAVGLTILFFLLDGRYRIARWHARTPRIPEGWGAPTLAAAVSVALLAPTLLGGAAPLLSFEGALRPRLVIIKPLSDVQRQLQVEPPIEVMRVVADRTTYWRLTGLPTYTGDEWILEARPQPVVDVVPLPEPPPSGELVHQQYRISSLLSPWLPAAFAASDVQVPIAYEIDEPSSTLLIQGESLPGLAYSVTSRLPADPHPAAALPVSDGPIGDTAMWRDLALDVVADTADPLEQAMGLERHFRSYTYDENVDGRHDEERLLRFLEERRGYCEQFAATMTLMLRGLGIPARVGVGFLPGRLQDGEHVVSTREAHAWVEARIPGIGWTNFDPTPGRGIPASESAPDPEPIQVTPAPVPEASAAPATPAPPEGSAQDALPEEAARVDVPRPLVFAFAVALLVGLVPGAKAVRRFRRRRLTGRAGVVAAWDELLDRAFDLGVASRDGETEWEFQQRRFGAATRAQRDGARALVWATLVARYGPEPAVTTADEAWRSLHSALPGLRAGARWWRRALAVVDPRTLLPDGLASRLVGSLRAAMSRVPGAARAATR